MRLRSFKLQNIGLFTDATVELGRNAAVIAGKNNSGKTSLLKAITTDSRSEPGPPRTLAVAKLTKHERETLPRIIEWEFEVEREDLMELARSQGTVLVPLPAGVDWAKPLDAIDEGQVRIRTSPPWRERNSDTISTSTPTSRVGVYRLEGDVLECVGYDDVRHRQISHLAPFATLVRFFCFDADRSRAHEKLVRSAAQLDSRGDELITLFNGLSSQRKLAFLDTVQRVLPEIRRLESVPSRDGHTSLQLWFGSDDRHSLGFNLSEVGYGTANALAILFAVISDPHARRIILIDEPTTYLHPRAVRELLAVLAEHKQHQYIFATHSFVGLESFPDASFSLCERKPGDEHATVVNCGSGPAADARRLLREVGSSLSDVFGADRIIWTEGPSDADVLELVLRDLRAPRGIAVRPILHTGDFEGHDAKPDPGGKRPALITKIYTTLSTSSALIPPAIAFVFDRERRKETQLEDLRRAIEGNVPTKEPRPKLALYDEHMLENLFLDAEVVVDALHQVARAEKVRVKVSPPDLEAFWDGLDDPKRFLTGKRPDDPKQWRKKVHGARVLEATFEHFFGDTVAFRKTTHDRMLAATALRLNSPGAASLRAFVQKLLAGNKDPEVPA
ncbi:MAG: AAA family ATPase [Kofleriaceae bacterium]|nr:AAA family ATPase [Kofleriaceae bacterium]MBP9167232.1 AAA family ATPase [Kofleriaceae bacterium]MBP9862837.1 AAA family ATPase [Kofleriaceae bacterium]